MINQIELAPKNDVNAVFIDEGVVIAKLVYNSLTHEYKLIYILGGLNKDKIATTLSKEERDRIILNEEKNILYGNIYISEGNLSLLL